MNLSLCRIGGLIGVFVCGFVAAGAIGNDAGRPGGSTATTQPSPVEQRAADTTVETVVFFRHGEKPANGLGNLTPQGLNRALGISVALPAKFGKPDFLFAPDPREKVSDKGGLYSYVRPLATIEPLAIRLGMPVETPCGYRDVAELNAELARKQYAGTTIFVAWEHGYAQRAAADLVKAFGGDASHVPNWTDHDYDSLYIVKITRGAGAPATAKFVLDHEGLDGQSTNMPTPAVK